MKKEKNSILNIISPILFGVFVIVFWELGGIHTVFSLKPYQLPVPTDIVEALINQRATIISNTLWTLQEAVIGIAIGSTIGFIIAVIATILPNFGKGGLSIVGALNAVPMIAMSPIMNNWFGMGMESKIAVVAMFTMAAMSINTHRGLTNLRPFALNLMHSYAASKFKIFFKLRLPNCIPNVLTALKISTTTGLMAAICSEFFSSIKGIGYDLSVQIKLAQMPMAWAYILVSAILGISMYLIVSAIERIAIKWHSSQR